MNRAKRSEPLSGLMDCLAIMDELGVKRGAAEAIMRNLVKVRIPGLRKVWVRREDVRALIEKNTHF